MTYKDCHNCGNDKTTKKEKPPESLILEVNPVYSWLDSNVHSFISLLTGLIGQAQLHKLDGKWTSLSVFNPIKLPI
jgi:hypothetical protein